MIEIVCADEGHAAALAARMRREDADECLALGASPLDAAVFSVAQSPYAWAALVDGEPAAIYGAAPCALLGTVACPWLLTADSAIEHKRFFLQENTKFISYLRSVYPVLETHVDARYGTAIRWMKWLGFTLHAPAPYGPLGMLFCRARMETEQ